MNLNIAKSINPTSGIVGVLFVSFFLQSCRSNDNVVENDGNSTAQNVKISLLVSDLDEEGPAKSASVDGKIISGSSDFCYSFGWYNFGYSHIKSEANS